VDPNGQAPLPANLLQFYNALFDADLASVDVQTDLTAMLMTRVAGKGAITDDATVYLNSHYRDEYEKGTTDGYSLLGHELVHVLQYQVLGVGMFRRSYAQNYLANREAGLGDYSAYKGIGQELVASLVESLLENFFDNNKGIREKLRKGLALSPQELEKVKSILPTASRNGQLGPGLQFIQGFLIYVPAR
jgi:hypothetical protein